jgi:hypothetical protein
MEWLEFWSKVGPAVLEFGQALFRHFDGDPRAAIAHVKRISTDFPKFEAARDEAEQGFAQLKRDQEPTPESVQGAAEPEPDDNEYVDPADHAPR